MLNHALFKEEQLAYYQGMMDAMQLLEGLNLLKTGNNMEKLIEKLQAQIKRRHIAEMCRSFKIFYMYEDMPQQ